MIRYFWRKIYPTLQHTLPRHRNNALLSFLYKSAIVFRDLYLNSNYNPLLNGEAWLLRNIAETCPEVVFDVGANIGNYALLVNQYSPTSAIYCFEPVPAVYTQLNVNVAGFKNISIFPEALADCEGDLVLHFDPLIIGNTSAISSVQSEIHNSQSIEVKAPKTTLDKFCLENSIAKINFLKIDVEGFEPNVLAGAKNMINSGNITCIQVEYGKANLFSKFFVHDYFKHYSSDYWLGKLYPNCVEWFDSYHACLDDLIGPNLVMLHRSNDKLYRQLSA